MARSRFTRCLLALLLVSSLVVLAGGTASAAGPTIACVMSGNVIITGATGDGWDWKVTGQGPCLDLRLRGPYSALVTGAGTSDTLGLCDGLIVQNLNLAMTLTVTNLRTNVTRVTTEIWKARITTFPLATPFFVGGGQTGLGAISTRILLNCPPAGSSGATMVFYTST